MSIRVWPIQKDQTTSLEGQVSSKELLRGLSLVLASMPTVAPRWISVSLWEILSTGSSSSSLCLFSGVVPSILAHQNWSQVSVSVVPLLRASPQLSSYPQVFEGVCACEGAMHNPHPKASSMED